MTNLQQNTEINEYSIPTNEVIIADADGEISASGIDSSPVPEEGFERPQVLTDELEQETASKKEADDARVLIQGIFDKIEASESELAA